MLRLLASALLLLLACVAAEAVVPHPSIHIQGDDDFLRPGNGVIGGTGTAEDPYRISHWHLVPVQQELGLQNIRTPLLQIEDTTAHVIVSHVTFAKSEGNAVVVKNSRNVHFSDIDSAVNEGVEFWGSQVHIQDSRIQGDPELTLIHESRGRALVAHGGSLEIRRSEFLSAAASTVRLSDVVLTVEDSAFQVLPEGVERASGLYMDGGEALIHDSFFQGHQTPISLRSMNSVELIGVTLEAPDSAEPWWYHGYITTLDGTVVMANVVIRGSGAGLGVRDAETATVRNMMAADLGFRASMMNVANVFYENISGGDELRAQDSGSVTIRQVSAQVLRVAGSNELVIEDVSTGALSGNGLRDVRMQGVLVARGGSLGFQGTIHATDLRLLDAAITLQGQGQECGGCLIEEPIVVRSGLWVRDLPGLRIAGAIVEDGRLGASGNGAVIEGTVLVETRPAEAVERAGILVWDGATAQNNRLQGTGISVSGGGHAIDNVIIEPIPAGIRGHSDTVGVVRGNVIERPLLDGIRYLSFRGTGVVEDNTIIEPGRDGIHAIRWPHREDGAVLLVLNNNEVRGAEENGLFFMGGLDVEMEDNTVTDSGNYGISALAEIRLGDGNRVALSGRACFGPLSAERTFVADALTKLETMCDVLPEDTRNGEPNGNSTNQERASHSIPGPVAVAGLAMFAALWRRRRSRGNPHPK